MLRRAGFGFLWGALDISALGGLMPGDERERLTAEYYGVYPDGRDRLSWPGLTHFRARPQWIRSRNYGQPTPLVVEFTAAQLTP